MPASTLRLASRVARWAARSALLLARLPSTSPCERIAFCTRAIRVANWSGLCESSTTASSPMPMPPDWYEERAIRPMSLWLAAMCRRVPLIWAWARSTSAVATSSFWPRIWSRV